MIVTIDLVIDYIDNNHEEAEPCVVGLTSLPADIIHSGHLELLRESKSKCDVLVVLVNDDDFLINKKGYFILPLEERIQIVDAIKWVDYTIAWHSENGLVDGAIRKIMPHLFLKGGDRSLDNIATEEIAACKDVNCKLVTDIGGKKKTSSSTLFEQAVKKYNKHNM